MSFVEFFQHNILFFAAGFVVLATLVTLEFRDISHRGSSLSPSALTRAVNDGAMLVDLRSANDFNKGHIAGAINVPFAQLEHKLERLGEQQGVVVLYCDKGSVASKATKQLKEKGFSEVKQLVGGMMAWQAAQLPVAKA